MARVTINSNTPVFKRSIDRVFFPNTQIVEQNRGVKINSVLPVFTRSIDRVSFPNTQIVEQNRGVKINSVLPFRIRFTTIQVPNSIANIPAIPLQIIGISNYIL